MVTRIDPQVMGRVETRKDTRPEAADRLSYAVILDGVEIGWVWRWDKHSYWNIQLADDSVHNYYRYNVFKKMRLAAAAMAEMVEEATARRARGGQILFRGEWYTLYTWRWDAFAGMWRACGGCNLYPAYRMVNEWRYDHAALVKRTDNRARFINTMRYW